MFAKNHLLDLFARRLRGSISVVSVSSVAMFSCGIVDVACASGHEPAAEPVVVVENPYLKDAKIRGVELGEYRIRAYYPVEAQKGTVRFVLHAAVASEKLAEVQSLVENRRHKLRDEVITATRMTPLPVFDEPSLTSFRRRILVRLRRALPELQFDDVFVSDFQLTVKSL
jgi:hypothetical protein